MSMSNAERAKNYRKRRKATGWQDRRGNRHPLRSQLPFIGVDGEGGEVVYNGTEWVSATDGKPHHEYLCLRIGEELLTNRGYAPLIAEQCLEFIADQNPEQGVYVSYFFDYDVTMILRELPRERLQRLMDRNARTFRMKHNGMSYTYPVEYCGYEFDYMPHKEFKVRRKGGKFVTINDVGTFYQCAFLKALQAWKIGTQEDWDHIAEGKSGRVNFGALTQETIRYNYREIVLLQELCESFRDATRAAEMEPKKWQGPGNIASALYDSHDMIKGQDVQEALPEPLLIAANESYFGGRFEITAVGHINDPVYQHDINSAYPYAETNLPCLQHGKWQLQTVSELSDNVPLPGELSLCYGTFTATGTPVTLYGLPVRDKLGRISWPANGGYGWYWSHEIRSAVYQKFHVEKKWVYEKRCDCEPFGFIPKLYNERAKLGKESKGIAIKLGLNSTYGKLCQSVGSPKYANPIYASLITSFTRSQLYDKCVRLGTDQVLMLATDGIFTTSQIDKDHSPKETRWDENGKEYTLKPLGDWEVSEWPNGIFIVQPGLYFRPGEKYAKTRGVPLNKFLESTDQFIANFDELYEKLRLHPVTVGVRKFAGMRFPSAFEETAITINVRNFMGIRLGVHINSDVIGQWNAEEKRISFDWKTKRIPRHELKDGYIKLFPYPIKPDNVPYSKDIGALWREAKLLSSGNQNPDAPEFLGMEAIDQ